MWILHGLLVWTSSSLWLTPRSPGHERPMHLCHTAVRDDEVAVTWCVSPARVHRGEVDLFVLRCPSLCQDHLLSLWGQNKHKDLQKNVCADLLPSHTSTFVFIVFSFSLLFSLGGKAYFILGVGHSAVKRSLLKLKIIQVQLLNQHSSRRHSDLKARNIYICFFNNN